MMLYDMLQRSLAAMLARTLCLFHSSYQVEPQQQLEL
jgi:hypothetical protein